MLVLHQGDAISLILFNLYVSDFQSYIGFDTHAPLLDTSFVHCLMYADDIVLISPLRKLLRVQSVISVNDYYIRVL